MPSAEVRSNRKEFPTSSARGWRRAPPVVSTFHSGIPDLLEDGTSGFLVPEREWAQLSERLAWLADHPEE